MLLGLLRRKTIRHCLSGVQVTKQFSYSGRSNGIGEPIFGLPGRVLSTFLTRSTSLAVGASLANSSTTASGNFSSSVIVGTLKAVYLVAVRFLTLTNKSSSVTVLPQSMSSMALLMV